MSYCVQCGKALQEEDIFCSNCGCKVKMREKVENNFSYAHFSKSVNQCEKSKVVAGLLAIFLGALGIHKFYLNQSKAGTIMLLVSILGVFLFGLGPVIMGIIGFFEGIIYLAESDQSFEKKYIKNTKEWF